MVSVYQSSMCLSPIRLETKCRSSKRDMPRSGTGRNQTSNYRFSDNTFPVSGAVALLWSLSQSRVYYQAHWHQPTAQQPRLRVFFQGCVDSTKLTDESSPKCRPGMCGDRPTSQLKPWRNAHPSKHNDSSLDVTMGLVHSAIPLTAGFPSESLENHGVPAMGGFDAWSALFVIPVPIEVLTLRFPWFCVATTAGSIPS
jgi:hypothetical protein